jgi:hypothetical protein
MEEERKRAESEDLTRRAAAVASGQYDPSILFPQADADEPEQAEQPEPEPRQEPIRWVQPAQFGPTSTERPIVPGRPVPRPQPPQEAPVEKVIDDSDTLLDYSAVKFEVPSSEEEYARTLAMLQGTSIQVAQAEVGSDGIGEGFVQPIDREWT